MAGGRPREFDRAEALVAAMDLFWDQGYQATSVDDLTTCMGIGRQSLYNEFGDKEQLFCEALRHYQQNIGGRFAEVLDAEGSPLGNIRTLLNAVVERCSSGDGRGCFMVNASMEFAACDGESAVLQTLKQAFAQLEKLLGRTLQRAVAAGELPREYDVRQWATFLTASVQGIMVMARTGGGRAALQRVADGALQAVGAR